MGKPTKWWSYQSMQDTDGRTQDAKNEVILNVTKCKYFKIKHYLRDIMDVSRASESNNALQFCPTALKTLDDGHFSRQILQLERAGKGGNGNINDGCIPFS